MSKNRKLNKVMERKIETRSRIEKKRAKKAGYLYLELDNDYYTNSDHLSYEDLNDLLNLPQRYSGEI